MSNRICGISEMPTEVCQCSQCAPPPPPPRNDPDQLVGWELVVFSADCNEDGDCPFCGIDYGDCACPGPTQDGYEYEEVNGILYARKIGEGGDGD